MSSNVGRYRKLYPRIWKHPDFRRLSKSARELTLYLLSGPQTSSIGLFPFSPATAAEDLSVGVETVRKGLADVSAAFGWHFDAVARVFYIPSWWRWNAPENSNVLKGNMRALSEIPPCGLVEAFARNLETLPETLHQTFMECLALRLPKRPPIQEQEQEQEQKTGTGARASRGKAGAPRRGSLSLAHENIGNAKSDDEAENGQDDERWTAIAKQVLQMTNPKADMDHLLDCFWTLVPRGSQSCSKPNALSALNRALADWRRTA